MKRAGLAVSALGGVLLLLAGCQSLDLGFSGPDGTVHARVLDGSPKVVAVSLQDSLKKRGLKAEIHEGADGTVVLECQPSSGAKFAVMLNSQRATDGHEQTRIALVGEANSALEVLVFGEIGGKK